MKRVGKIPTFFIESLAKIKILKKFSILDKLKGGCGYSHVFYFLIIGLTLNEKIKRSYEYYSLTTPYNNYLNSYPHTTISVSTSKYTILYFFSLLKIIYHILVYLKFSSYIPTPKSY